EEMEAFALESHARAVRAIDEGRFESQIAPVTMPDGTVVSADEGPRREPDVDKMRSLKTLLPDGRTTAAVASQISDASAALLIASEQAVRDHGLTPRARIHHLSVRGADPVWMLTAPILATAYALERAGMTVDDIDLFETNEDLASVEIGRAHV